MTGLPLPGDQGTEGKTGIQPASGDDRGIGRRTPPDFTYPPVGGSTRATACAFRSGRHVRRGPTCQSPRQTWPCCMSACCSYAKSQRVALAACPAPGQFTPHSSTRELGNAVRVKVYSISK